jgi:SAM-dependent methyltransferase
MESPAIRRPEMLLAADEQNETVKKSREDLYGLREQIVRLEQSLSSAVADLRQAQIDFHTLTGKQLERLKRAIIETGALPPELPYVFRPDYEAFLYYFIALGGLRRGHVVLDVGCGDGEMAEQLVGYLSPTARYEGFDVRAHAIAEQRHISKRYPHFHFQHANLFNKSYNPDGTVAASDYVYPFEDQTFDFVFLLSVFTHMFPADMDHYLAEISRVLKPTRRCLITYFLLNDESIRLIESGATRKTFRHSGQHFRFEDQEVPERAIAVDEGFVREMYGRHQLRIVEPIHYGRWCRRRGPEMRQDMIVAVKE